MTDLKFELLSILYNNPLQLHSYDDLRKPKSEKHVEIKAALDWLIDEGYISRALTGLAYCEITNKGRSAFEEEQLRKREAESRKRESEAHSAEEREDRSLNRKFLIADLVISILALIVSIIALFFN